jgi:hypothetical protein
MQRTRHTVEQIIRKLQDCRAADRAGQDRRRAQPRHRGDAADVSPLTAAVRWNAGRGGQAADPAETENAMLKKHVADAELEKEILKNLVAP